MAPGTIYAVRNPSHKQRLLKIGTTTRHVLYRLEELNSPKTSQPDPFEIVACYEVADSSAAEKVVHEALAAHRYRTDREFFQIAPSEAVAIMTRVLGTEPSFVSREARADSRSSEPSPRPAPREVRSRQAGRKEKKAELDTSEPFSVDPIEIVGRLKRLMNENGLKHHIDNQGKLIVTKDKKKIFKFTLFQKKARGYYQARRGRKDRRANYAGWIPTGDGVDISNWDDLSTIVRLYSVE